MQWSASIRPIKNTYKVLSIHFKISQQSATENGSNLYIKKLIIRLT